MLANSNFYVKQTTKKGQTPMCKSFMPATGIEPVLCCHNRILSPARLPVPPHRHVKNGRRRIRTFEGSASRFTVCPLWPLGNPPKILTINL